MAAPLNSNATSARAGTSRGPPVSGSFLPSGIVSSITPSLADVVSPAVVVGQPVVDVVVPAVVSPAVVVPVVVVPVVVAEVVPVVVSPAVVVGQSVADVVVPVVVSPAVGCPHAPRVSP